MKPFDVRTSKFVMHELNLLRAAINSQFNDSQEEENTLIPTTQILTTGNTLFDMELSIPDSLGNKRFISRH